MASFAPPSFLNFAIMGCIEEVLVSNLLTGTRVFDLLVSAFSSLLAFSKSVVLDFKGGGLILELPHQTAHQPPRQ